MAVERAKRIGGRIRELRKEQGLKQHELGARIGTSVTKDYVSRWENGKVDAALGPYMDAIAKALETTEADLMAGPVAEREPQGEAPDLLGTLDGDVDQEQLNRMERLLEEIRDLLRPGEDAGDLPDELPPDEGLPPADTSGA